MSDNALGKSALELVDEIKAANVVHVAATAFAGHYVRVEKAVALEALDLLISCAEEDRDDPANSKAFAIAWFVDENNDIWIG
ncbi:hypothetical protein M5E06_17810 [Azospirillum sp. A1-3]|uniref:hypothetical protein n=1 Tax=Azospirillum sp. A1-3 TaxID=185874 RepID=UPI0020771727|nr:hypothetical protein [Azospirillum sp. A1-3]MCM8735992.1 hypothetical protein [Azospirillum sp. A1-3]